MDKRVGAVVIGRNEGERLRACLTGVSRQASRVVYVDSGSTDDSVDYAKSIPVEVIQLDTKTPFSAARARNEGFRFLRQRYPGILYIQFIDGDCELMDSWLDRARSFLGSNAGYAIVVGRVIERFPDRSVYNRLCNIEWNAPAGNIRACGGVFMIRCSAFESVGGFNPAVIAGEEPDLCYRLGRGNWELMRLGYDMATHDSAMLRFGQWWNRAKRAGHAYAQGFSLHSGDGEGYYLIESMKCWVWGLGLPLLIVLSAPVARSYALLIALLFPARACKIALDKYRQCKRFGDAALYGVFTTLASWPQLTGQFLYLKRALLRGNFKIIEHK